MIGSTLTLASCLLSCASLFRGSVSVSNTTAPSVPRSVASETGVEKRIDNLIAQMTLDEKIDMVNGDGMSTHAVPRLGIPALRTTDGPMGVRWGAHTAFPASIALGASFDPNLIKEVGHALGRETRLAGRNTLLGPCINIVRTPMSGRNAETFGEDPHLNGRAAAAYVQGVQAEKVITTTKHFALNNQEKDRMTINVEVSPRAIREIYLPAFQAAVEAGSWGIMSAYNKVGGLYLSENGYFLNGILKSEWGFRGFVMSDWEATHSTEASALNGLDIEMPSKVYFGDPLREAVASQKIPMSVLDDKVRRILRALIQSGVMDDDPVVADSVTQARVEGAHKSLALRAAQESMVLLQNSQIEKIGRALPLDAKQIKRLALIGPSAAIARYSSGGSGHAVPASAVSPLAGFRHRLGSATQVDYAPGVRLPNDATPIPHDKLIAPHASLISPIVHGLRGEYFDNPNLEGSPRLVRIDPRIDFDWAANSPDESLPSDFFSVRWTGQILPRVSGKHRIVVGSDDGVRLYLNGKLVIDDWHSRAFAEHGVEVNVKAGLPLDVRLEYFEGMYDARVRLEWEEPEPRLNDAVQLAKKSDAAIVVVGWPYRIESEDIDRQSLTLPGDQERLIEAVAQVNPRTIVVLHSGGPVDVSRWKSKVAAIVDAWFFGEEGGNALADVILGNVNPSGKLPMTFPRHREDASDYPNYPGQNNHVDYKEGIFVGYRFFDHMQTEPEFPFGFGLSYTDFKIETPTINVESESHSKPHVQVTIPVRNTGKMAGAEVVQVYVHAVEPAVMRPPKELKGFKKVRLAAGEQTYVKLDLDARAFAYFDETTMSWKNPRGSFEILVGNSSRSVRSAGTVTLR